MLFTSSPRVSIHFVRYSRHSRGYPAGGGGVFSAALVCPIHLEIPSFGTIPEMCSRRLNLKAKMTRTCPGHPKGSFGTLGCPLLGGTPASIHSFRELFTSFPRVSIRFVCYLHYSRWYPFILYSISPFPPVSIDFVRYLHNSRGYPFILQAIYVIPAGIHSFCMLFNHSRGYPFILYVIYIIPAGIHLFCPLFTSFPRVCGGGVDAVVHWQMFECVLRIWFRFASLCPRLAHITPSLAFAKF